MPNYPPSPAPLSDRDTYTTWPGGVDPTARVYAGGKRRRANTRRGRRVSTRRARRSTRRGRRNTRRSTRRVSSRRVFQYVM